MVWTGIAALASRRQRTQVSRRQPARRAAPTAGTPDGVLPVSEPEGPGWFESSRDLQSGLAVCEGAPPGLEVYVWIEQTLLEITQRDTRATPAAPLMAADERPGA
jgi:hypothetical protein